MINEQPLLVQANLMKSDLLKIVLFGHVQNIAQRLVPDISLAVFVSLRGPVNYWDLGCL